MKIKSSGPFCASLLPALGRTTGSPFCSGAAAGLNPGVRRAGILFCPVRRPPYARVKVHVVVGFQPVGLRAVVGRGRVGDDILQVRVLVPGGVFQVHSVSIVVPPALLLGIIQWLPGKELFRLDLIWNVTRFITDVSTNKCYSV